MKCSHLITARSFSTCNALKQPYIPSTFQLSEYCRTTLHRKCPFHLNGATCPKRMESERATTA